MLVYETVTILRPSATSFTIEGDPAASTDTPILRPGCLVADSRSKEQTERGREGAIGDWTVYMPPGVAPLYTDRMTVREIICEVVGFPEDWRSTLPWQYVAYVKRPG